MKKILGPIVFFGNERLATGVDTSLPTLNMLMKNGYEVAAIVSSNITATSRKTRELEVKTFADKNKIPLLLPDKLSTIKAQLKTLKAQIGVLVAFGQMVPDDIIDIFPLGIINIHPSLLPLHRGPTPIESVILDGSSESGVSLMQLIKAMDAGPVFAQENIKLTGTETKQELADMFGEHGAKLVIKHLPAIIAKKLKPVAQSEDKTTYDQLITKLDGAIDWNQRADQIEKQIRAYYNWPSARAQIIGKDVIITKAEIIDNTGVPGEVLARDKKLIVCCGDKAIQILSLIPAGKKEMSGQAFLAGYGKHLK